MDEVREDADGGRAGKMRNLYRRMKLLQEQERLQEEMNASKDEAEKQRYQTLINKMKASEKFFKLL
jgi:hypothetical protein